MAAATTFGSRLKELRIGRGLTQQALAHPHYTHAYVSSLEAGRRQPSQDALDHFAAKLDVDPDELLTGRPAGLSPSLELQLHEARITASAGQLQEADAAFLRIAAEAERFDLVHVRARAEYGRGAVCELSGRVNDALAHYEKTQELLKEHPDVARTDAVVGQARCAQDLGDVRYAIYLLESHLDSLARSGLEDPTSRMVVYATMVLPYLKLGVLRKAGECAERALALTPRVIDPAKLATMHVNVARVLLEQRNFIDATASLRRAEDLFRQLDLQVELGIAHLALGFVLKRDGKPDASKAELTSAIRIFTSAGSKVNEASALNELAAILREEGEIDEARSVLMRSIDLLKNEDDVSELAQAHRELALCSLDTDANHVEKHLHLSIELFEKAEEPMQVAATYRVLGDFLRAKGRADEGCEAYRTGIVELERHI